MLPGVKAGADSLGMTVVCDVVVVSVGDELDVVELDVVELDVVELDGVELDVVEIDSVEEVGLIEVLGILE